MEFIILPLLLLTSLVVLTVGGAIYLLFAFGLYKMAKNLFLPSPWMAFVPVASSYLLGLIAEKDSMGKLTLKYSWILLVSQIISCVFSGAYYFVGTIYYVFGNLFALIAVFGLCAVFSIISAVFYYIALYRVYKLYDPDNAPIFLILSILFSISVPIFIFILRNRQPIIYYASPFEHKNYDN